MKHKQFTIRLEQWLEKNFERRPNIFTTVYVDDELPSSKHSMTAPFIPEKDWEMFKKCRIEDESIENRYTLSQEGYADHKEFRMCWLNKDDVETILSMRR